MLVASALSLLTVQTVWKKLPSGPSSRWSIYDLIYATQRPRDVAVWRRRIEGLSGDDRAIEGWQEKGVRRMYDKNAAKGPRGC